MNLDKNTLTTTTVAPTTTTTVTTTAAPTTAATTTAGECDHAFGPWEDIDSTGGRSRTCSKCGIFEFSTATEAEEDTNSGCRGTVGTSIAFVAIVPMLGAAFIAKKKRK